MCLLAIDLVQLGSLDDTVSHAVLGNLMVTEHTTKPTREKRGMRPGGISGLFEAGLP